MTMEQQETVSPTDIFAGLPGAPDASQRDVWKQTYGEIFCSGFSDQEVYIWRPVNREEWSDIQKWSKDAQPDETAFQEMLVRTCLLWSSDKEALKKKAGSLPSLFEQIMLNSNFMTPQVAAALVIKL